MRVGKLNSDHALLQLGLTDSGTWQLAGNPLLSTSDSTSKTPDSEPQPQLNYTFAEVNLHQYTLLFADETRQPPVILKMDPVSIQLRDLTRSANVPFKFDLALGIGKKGVIKSQGQAKLSPLALDAKLDVNDLRLQPLGTYWDDLVGFRVMTGRVNLKGEIAINPASQNHSFSGNMEITRFKTVDKIQQKEFVRWNTLRLDGLVISSNPQKLSLKSAILRDPCARVVISPAGELNLGQLFVVNQHPENQTRPSPSWPIVIGSVHVNNGCMNFSDLTLEPGFSTDILGLHGSIQGLSSQSQSRADINMTGFMDNNSPVRITGQGNPFMRDLYTNIIMTMNDINLTNFSPYSGKFAGYRIEKGKLDMDLHYQVSQRKLKAENRMVINQLELGERVESPDATSLPVRLALALLKDSQGRIDISLPVTGRLDDPRFSIASVLGEAFTQAISKLVRSPFAVLGHLVSAGQEDLAKIGFQPGAHELNPDELTKLDKVAAIILQRPGLTLDIKGISDLEQDAQALAERELKEQLAGMRKTEQDNTGQQASLSDTEYHAFLTEFVRLNYPVSPEINTLNELGQTVLNDPLFASALAKVLRDWPVDHLALRKLAQERGEVIRAYLTVKKGLPDSRVFLRDVRIESDHKNTIKTLLSLNTGS